MNCIDSCVDAIKSSCSLGLGSYDDNGKVTVVQPTNNNNEAFCKDTDSLGTASTMSSFCSADEYDNDDNDDNDEAVSASFIMKQSLVLDHAASRIIPIVQFTEPDEYGQVHPIENPQLIAYKLKEFNYILNQKYNTKNIQIAKEKCPDIILQSKFILMFLRCECYDVERATKRFAKYWDKRVEVFGKEKAFRKLTINNSLSKEDQDAIRTGSLHIIYRKQQRNILFFNPGKLQPTKYTRESSCRAFWYIFHALIEEDELVQRYGVIVILDAATFTNKNRDPNTTRMCFSSMQGSLPVRISSFHCFHIPRLYRMVAHFVLFLLGDRLRKRVFDHSHYYKNDTDIINLLESNFNIYKQHIPPSIGGDYKLDIEQWIKQRQKAGL